MNSQFSWSALSGTASMSIVDDIWFRALRSNDCTQTDSSLFVEFIIYGQRLHKAIQGVAA